MAAQLIGLNSFPSRVADLQKRVYLQVKGVLTSSDLQVDLRSRRKSPMVATGKWLDPHSQ